MYRKQKYDFVYIFLAYGSVSVNEDIATIGLHSNAQGKFNCFLDGSPLQQCNIHATLYNACTVTVICIAIHKDRPIMLIFYLLRYAAVLIKISYYAQNYAQE